MLAHPPLFLELTDYRSKQKKRFRMDDIHQYGREEGALYSVITSLIPGPGGVASIDIGVKETPQEIDQKMLRVVRAYYHFLHKSMEHWKLEGEDWKEDDDEDEGLQGFHLFA